MKKILFGEFVGGRGAVGLLALRVVVGLAFIFHGWGKIQNPFGWMGEKATMPGMLQALAALSEFGGGIALIIGLVTPLAAFGLACTMFVAMTVHIKAGDPFVGRPSYELAAVYLVTMIAFLLLGPGKLSLDAVLFGGCKERKE